MEKSLFNNKRINCAVLILIVVISLFVVAKIVNEVKTNRYIGRDVSSMNTISVDGEGEVSAIPDIATLSMTLSKEAATSKEAQTLLNESVTKVVSYLKEKSIEDKDVKSEYGGLTPKYSYEKCYTYNCPVNSKITGYTATQTITVKVREVDNANDIRTGLAELGVTDISGPTFSIDEEEVFQDEARAKAIADAKIKAEVLAKNLGVKLGKIVSYSEGGDFYRPMYEKSMMDAGSAAMLSSTAPVLPKGENKITSNVTVIYEIR